MEVTATQWHRVDEDGNDTEDLEDPIIYIDTDDEDAVYEVSIEEALRIVDQMLLAILQAREWVEGYMPISGNTTNFLYSLRATTTHTGGMHAQDQVRR